MSTRYDAPATEAKWYAAWEAAGLFQPDADPNKPPFTITIPPPNITGALHMGHALCYPLQDAVGRYQRLRGKSVLVLPGQDHAGIATQSVVERQLRKEGSSGAQIGRERFVERTWAWRKESGDAILSQFRRLGCAFDWQRSRLTLDDNYHRAVLDVFIEWFDRGLIFRGKRVVNWDPVLQTSVSDIETERRTVRGKLYYVRYPFVDGSGDVTIATTRPETMLADVAVAVHPSDRRYAGKVGKSLLLPLVGREIPLIEDIYPDPAFGSGAVKITPAHDPNDYLVGVRHDLPMPVLLDERAQVTAEGGVYAGLDRLEARKRIVLDLEEQGFLVKVEDHEMNVTVSERSGEVIEPLLSEQWFCDQAALAGPVIEAVRCGDIRFFPERYDAIFIEWMQNIREWCLSRQLWWGHRIPVFYTEDGVAVAARSQVEAEQKAGKPIVRQDEDVLDTWFSSGLWPFAALGWPEESADLKARYPTSVLITDRNIINLWVARMAMMGLDLAGAKPFGHVMIYATVLTEDGRRMSKSLGTGVDPNHVIETVGADALRYTLQSQTGGNQDIRYSERRVEDARNLTNKLWNATRFVILNVGDACPPEPASFELVDRWLLSRLESTRDAVTAAYDRYDFQAVCQSLYRFFWNEMCDWYIEVSKPRLADPDLRETPQWVLLTALTKLLTMLHPVMPHLTEELYAHLPVAGKSPFLMSAAWPTPNPSHLDAEAEQRVERAFEITRTFRALRASLDLAAMTQAPVGYLVGESEGLAEMIRTQAWLGELRESMPAERVATASVHGVEVSIPIASLPDRSKFLDRLGRERDKAAADIAKLAARLANPQFVERAKPEIVEKERGQLAELETTLRSIEERLRILAD
ncbi:MAG: valine--tRNA ligase [Fimbriimonadaceae bacterium]